MPPNPKPLTPIEATKHADTRLNIPTEEMRDLVDEQEKAPQTLLYPRDPSLDPQLVWRGKDEQDREALAVPAVPIYIQEKIHPQALIEDLRAESQKTRPPADQPSLFSDFNGLAPLESIDFYRHDQHWTNRMILGDSLLVMASLAEKEGLKGKVQMIYMDPPYGIKFGSNWQVSTRKRDVGDTATDVNREPEVVRAFRDTWKLGIHSYLSYLRDRLVLARELLTESGSIFVQIGDENVHLVRSLMDEVFGAENFASLVTVKKTGAQTTTLLPPITDYILWYSKSREHCKFRQPFRPMTGGEGHSTGERYDQALLSTGVIVPASRASGSDDARLFRHVTLSSNRPAKEHERRQVEFQGRTFLPPPNRTWTTTEKGMARLRSAGRLWAGRESLNYAKFLDDFPANPLGNLWEDLPGVPEKIYVV